MTVDVRPTIEPRRVAAGIAILVIAYATTLVAREALAGFAGVVLVLAYAELRRLLVRHGSRVSLLLGAAAVGALVWIGSAGRPQDLVWVLVALMLSLLAGRVVLAEVGRRDPRGATADVGGTIVAAGLVGALGAHVLLVRAVPRFGAGGVVVFLSVVVAGTIAALLGDRFGRHGVADAAQRRTWEGIGAQIVAAAIVGLVAGVVADPPFGLVSGTLLGAGTGAVLAVGGLAGAALVRGGVSGRPGTVFRSASGPLLAAPAFYWAFRTLVL